MIARPAARLDPLRRVSSSSIFASCRRTTKNENIINTRIRGNIAKASFTFRLTRLSVERCPLTRTRFGAYIAIAFCLPSICIDGSQKAMGLKRYEVCGVKPRTFSSLAPRVSAWFVYRSGPSQAAAWMDRMIRTYVA